MHSIASGSPSSSSSQTAAAMTGASILADILATLNRLEARLQDQDARLDGIVQSLPTTALGSLSPVTTPTSLCDDDGDDGDEWRQKTEPRKRVIMTGQGYQASVAKLRRCLFNFDSRSELAVGKNDNDDDGYTASVYPSRSFSRPDILDSCSEPPTAAPPPRLRSAAADLAPNHHDTGSSRRPFSGSCGSSLASPAAAVSPAATFASRRRRRSSSGSSRRTSWREKASIIAGNTKRRLTARSSRSSRSSQASTTSHSSAKHGGEAKAGGGQRRSHERVEMALYAYDNFFQSFRRPRCHTSEAEGTTVRSLVLALRRLVRLAMKAGTAGGRHEGTASLVS